MPRRAYPLISGEIYHVYNRTIANQSAFTSENHFQRAVNLIDFYCRSQTPIRYSYFIRLTLKTQTEILSSLSSYRSKIICFCLMPTHFHFLLNQSSDEGIKNFIHDFQDSYVKYFNILNRRNGALFQASFKAVRITSGPQFLHVSRYIHLNPYSSDLIKNLNQLVKYRWSSFPCYADQIKYDFLNIQHLMNNFTDLNSFLSFTLNQAEYQKTLNFIKHH